MATEKEDIYSKFYPFVDTHVDFWRGRRVIPYSRAYADAYAAYVQTRKEAEKDRERRMDLYIAVGMLAGVAMCGLGPVAGVIAAGKRPARIAIVSLANAAGRLGITNRAAAWALMTKFTFGGMPQIATAVWGSQGKDILKKHLNKFTGGVATTGKSAAAVQTPLRNDIKRDKMPIEYFLELDGLLLKAKNAITGCAVDMINNPGVSATEFQQYCDETRKSNLFTKSPRTDMTDEQMTRLANEMEMALWAFAACSWKQTHTKKVPTGNRNPHRATTTMTRSTTNRSGRTVTSTVPAYTQKTNEYSNYLEENRVLERIDKVAKNLGMSHYITERSPTGSPKLQLNGGASWDNHFGVWHSDDEKDLLIKWANTYVAYKASKVVMPLELK